MNRQEKVEAVDKLRQQFDGIRNAFVIDYKGVTVPEVSALRQVVRETGASYAVVKNTMVRRAVEGMPLGQLSEFFTGPTAVAWHPEDPVALAKVLHEFIKKTPSASFKAALVDGQAISADRVGEIASLPSLDELKTQLVCALAGPLRRLAIVLGGPSSGFANVLRDRAGKLS